MNWHRLASVSAVGIALAACGSSGTMGNTTGIPDACNPLGGGACLLPWPSMVYADADATSATGFRVHIPIEAMPSNTDPKVIDPAPFNRYDGFSPNAVIVVAFPTGVSAQGLPPHTDLTKSMADDAPIVVMNMDTGERVPFFAEVDANEQITEAKDRALLIRVVKRMAPKSRYVVAIRKTVKAADGSELPPNPAFQAIVDGTSFDHPLFAKLAARYPDIFTKLAAAGIQKTELALAWDFVTASDEFLTSDLLAMRTQALPMMAGNGATLTYTATVKPGVGDPSLVSKFITGTFDAPMFLNDLEADDSMMVRDAQGLPVVNGVYRAKFAALIPACAVAQKPIPVIVFGHGLFGSGEDFLNDGFLMQVANDNCVVGVATDWIGLAQGNVATAAYAVNDGNKFPGIIDKLAQSVINTMSLARIIRGPMAADPMFMDAGQPIVDPTRIWYYGASLGGIMGNVYMAYEPDIVKGALGVPGGNWTLNFERSLAWPPLQLALQNSYTGYVLDQEIIALIGMMWDRYDPITTTPHVVMDPLPGTPAKQIYLYEGIGDSLVTNLSTEMVARTMGLSVTAPSLYVPFGMTSSTDATSSGMTILDEHVTPVPSDLNIPPSEDSGTHSGVNKRQAVQTMVRQFLEQGTVQDGCKVGGAAVACDCATGACGNRL